MGIGITGENGNGREWESTSMGTEMTTISHGNLFPSSFQRMQATVSSEEYNNIVIMYTGLTSDVTSDIFESTTIVQMLVKIC